MAKSLYDRRWRKRRAHQLALFPLCRMHLDRGEVVAAQVADHIVPHRNDPVLFAGPLMSLCAECHNSVKQSIEKGGDGLIRGCDARGNPLDPRHPWNTHGGES